MRRYLRTKDGIFDISDNGYACWQTSTPVEPERQADAIEELCDFVMVKHHWEKLPNVHNIKELKNKSKELYGDSANIMDSYKYLIELSKKPNTPAILKLDYIKFAIDTERGLIYVAEMNDDGELVLI